MTPQMPSRSGLLLRVVIAAAVGVFIVFCVILPAEYRRDPTGFGRLTGLLELTTPRVAAVPDPATAKEGDVSSDPEALPQVSGGMLIAMAISQRFQLLINGLR